MYKVCFIDGTEFEGGDPKDSKWNDIPDKPISRLQYSLLGLTFTLNGFEAYNHILEKAIFINKPTIKSSDFVSRIILMGKWQGRIYMIEYDFIKGKVFQKIDVFSRIYTGWKNGEFNSNCSPRIRQIKG